MSTNLVLSRLYTISPIGLVNNPGGVTTANNGATFGPDTLAGATAPGSVGPPYSQTSGLQEALNSIASGGTIQDIGGVDGTGAPVPYLLETTLYGQGNDQTLILNGNSILKLGLPTGNSAFGPFYYGKNFSRCRWLGNGATIDLNNLALSLPLFDLSQTTSDTNRSQGCELSGFNIDTGYSNPVRIINMGYPSGTSNPLPTFDQCVRQFRISRINVSADFSGTSSANMIDIAGSVREIVFNDCTFDYSMAPGFSGQVLYVGSNNGESRDIVFRRCLFRTNGSGNVIQLEGANNGLATPTVQTRYIAFYDCEIDSGETSGNVGHTGTGGVLLDDNGGTNTNAFLNNVEWVRCNFVDGVNSGSTGISFEASSVGTIFGYVRFRDCAVPSPGFVDPSHYTFPYRRPASAVPVSVPNGVGTSQFTYVNTEGVDLVVVVYQGSGSISDIKVDSQETGLTSGVFLLAPLHNLVVTYTGTINFFIASH